MGTPRCTSIRGFAGQKPEPPLILLVEDNRADVYLMRESIQTAHVAADLQVLPNGEAAIRFLDNADRDECVRCPALVILDLNLPRKSGMEVLRHLRRSRRNAHAPVLIVTSSDSLRDREETARLGANEYFRKPTEYDAYIRVGASVKRLIERSNAESTAGSPR